MFTGCGTALVTPFRHDLSLDEDDPARAGPPPDRGGHQLSGPLRHHRREPHAHARRAPARRRDHARRGQRQSPGARRSRAATTPTKSSNSPARSKRMGADGILSVTPYYNKPTQEGLYQHYRAIASAIRLPIVVYSVQGRTGVNVEPATLARLAQIENIVGVKEACGNIGQMANVLHEVPAELHRPLRRRRHHHSADRARRTRHHLGRLQRNSRRDDADRASLPARRFRRARAHPGASSCR